ncbi:MAG: TetM/TetW/TetO/TetS family tetracycline resistance ribosomal protection protein [Clostridia bacterium]|nr:TetM/TetW/TetO/TetS family tetracycline resistance ribosomal protection protein [Clostridia bacterium]
MAIGPVIGLCAHVDAGKTTLSESMLFLSGSVRRQGRVDHGDAFLDTDRMEKERGITIFSKEARLSWRKTDLTLVDTPGHIDFSGEAERALGILDLAVLVISASDGVQSHTRTLWRLLEQRGIPVVLFLNKTDLLRKDPDALLASLHRELSEQIVPFPSPDPEKLALCDETCLDAYLRQGEIPPRLVDSLIASRRIFPLFSGSALHNEGVEPLMGFLAGFDPRPAPSAAFGARVYKVSRDPQGARLVFLKVTGGTLKTRDLLTLKSPEGETLWAEKAAELRLYSGARYSAVPEVSAGQICCVVGLGKALPGDGLGSDPGPEAPLLRPCYACRLVPPAGADLHAVLTALRALEEEEPLIRVEYAESRREIRIHSMGDVWLEVLHRRMLDRFGLDVSFTESTVLYRETIEAPVEGAGHYEPLRHYAEVHLLLSPLPRGSGLICDSAVSTDDLALNWQRLIVTHLHEKVHVGVLTGSPLTDLRITLVSGKAHLKHTEGGDFRQATYRALRQGLMKARSILLEPWMTLDLTVPEDCIGRVLSDLSQMGGRFDAPDTPAEDGLLRLSASVPAAACDGYGRAFGILTRGRGGLASSFLDWEPCAAQEKVVLEKGYDPCRDVLNTPDSVFCSHGAGVTVPWDKADAYMHLPFLKDRNIRRDSPVSAAGISGQRPVSSSAYRGTREEDLALEKIFERTYGPVKARQLVSPPPAAAENPPPPAPAGSSADASYGEILLVDGYNIIHAWEEYKSYLPDRLADARDSLRDLLCDYAGATGRNLILVFDAYAVPGNPGRAEKYQNIYIVYTREAQTADAFIEQTTYVGRNLARIRVVTSDRPEQLVVAGHAALRTSAREFHGEITRVRGDISAFLARNNRPRHDRVIEHAFKEAWKKSREP